jgi:CRISPR-associated protein Csd1
MILQALHRYYLRKQDEMPPEGFDQKEIPFFIVLDLEGRFVDLQDTRTSFGKKMLARKFVVPRENERSGKNAWQITNMLWDHYGYVLGWPKSDTEKDRNTALKQHGVFVEQVETLRNAFPDDEDIRAVSSFLNGGRFDNVFAHPAWKDCVKIPGCNLSFQMSGLNRLICENKNVQSFISGASGEDEEEEGDESHDTAGICLITGEHSSLARLHLRTPIAGSKSNAKIVSFQKNMGFDSYGKQQSFNAPVCKSASFSYATALRHMLAKDSRQKLMVGDATTVFWAEKKHDLEDVFADIFGEPAKDNPVQDYKAIVAKFRAPQIGAKAELDPGTRFYVLGLAPNAARIAVRFWYEGTVAQVSDNINQHFEDCAIVHGPNQPETLSLFRLLVSTATQGKSENIQPNLAGDFMRSILSGTPYPKTLLSAAVRRIRAEREITYPRAALVKAVLARESRYYKRNMKEVDMALDTSNDNIGYRMGRLFAALEKIQEEASPGINATIRDRFYGAASSTPVAVFSHLMKLKNHHLSKLDNRGRAVNFERLIGEIIDDINEFPSHLSLADQGRFAVGYYHQRQDFFTKKDQ